MSLKPDQVRDVARLARLAVEDADVEHYAKNLSDILEMVEQLNGCDTSGITPMAHPLEMVQRQREDVVSETDQRERFQSIAPETADGHYLVPKVID